MGRWMLLPRSQDACACGPLPGGAGGHHPWLVKAPHSRQWGRQGQLEPCPAHGLPDSRASFLPICPFPATPRLRVGGRWGLGDSLFAKSLCQARPRWSLGGTGQLCVKLLQAFQKGHPKGNTHRDQDLDLISHPHPPNSTAVSLK